MSSALIFEILIVKVRSSILTLGTLGVNGGLLLNSYTLYPDHCDPLQYGISLPFESLYVAGTGLTSILTFVASDDAEYSA